jgi:hypothetical protein
MIPVKLDQVLKNEGVVAIATRGLDGPHLVNTWHSYVKATEDDRLIIPVGGMKETESNLEKDNDVKVTVGSREVEGFHGKGTGFCIDGKASILKQGPEYEEVKTKFTWARAALEIKVNEATQTL